MDCNLPFGKPNRKEKFFCTESMQFSQCVYSWTSVQPKKFGISNRSVCLPSLLPTRTGRRTQNAAPFEVCIPRPAPTGPPLLTLRLAPASYRSDTPTLPYCPSPSHLLRLCRLFILFVSFWPVPQDGFLLRALHQGCLPYPLGRRGHQARSSGRRPLLAILPRRCPLLVSCAHRRASFLLFTC